MRAYALIRISGGAPAVGTIALTGYCLGASAGAWGMYLISAPLAQILAVDALPNSQAVGICSVSQLPDIISTAKRTELNTWTDTYFPSLPTIPVGATYQQVVDGLFLAANVHYVSGTFFLRPGGLSSTPALVKTVVVGPQNPANIQTHINGSAYHLIDIGDDYALWQVDSDEDNLIALHRELWALPPASSLGVLAVVQTFGESFYNTAVMDTFDYPASELIARRDRIAAYLESLGYSNTSALRSATTEDAQMTGIVQALGYTENQMWGAMTP